MKSKQYAQEYVEGRLDATSLIMAFFTEFSSAFKTRAIHNAAAVSVILEFDQKFQAITHRILALQEQRPETLAPVHDLAFLAILVDRSMDTEQGFALAQLAELDPRLQLRYRKALTLLPAESACA